MYCPVCLNDTLSINQRGVIKIMINGKHRDTNLFLFNLQSESKEEVFLNLSKKIEEFFKWYSSFQNKAPIENFEIYSNDFNCTTGCSIPITTKISVIEPLFDPVRIHKLFVDMGNKYEIIVNLSGA